MKIVLGKNPNSENGFKVYDNDGKDVTEVFKNNCQSLDIQVRPDDLTKAIFTMTQIEVEAEVGDKGTEQKVK